MPLPMRVALITCAELPEPDPDEALLVAALAARGLEPSLAAWDDPNVAWSGFTLGVLRSTWNYHRDPGAFVEWLELAATQVPLLNPPDLVRWNLHKAYLIDLERRGFAIVPTAVVRAGDDGARLSGIRATRGWDEVVIKPAISAASHETLRVGPDELERGQEHLIRLAAQGDVLVQPCLRSVLRDGERSLIAIEGALTHAVRKAARFHGEHERVEGPLPIAPDERALAEAVLEQVAPGALYARVDLARDDEGQPRILELELIEPSLFLAQSEDALSRLADAIAARARGASSPS